MQYLCVVARLIVEEEFRSKQMAFPNKYCNTFLNIYPAKVFQKTTISLFGYVNFLKMFTPHKKALMC